MIDIAIIIICTAIITNIITIEIQNYNRLQNNVVDNAVNTIHSGNIDACGFHSECCITEDYNLSNDYYTTSFRLLLNSTL